VLQDADIVRSYPHDAGAFTQGLLVQDGRLFESTGLEGLSTVREVRLEDGAVLRSAALPPADFGEGLVDWGGQIISLTWRSGIGFRWDRNSLRRLGTFAFRGEGWGATRNESDIIVSDGTPVLRFLDPETMAERRRLTVTEGDRPLGWLNDLQWVEGEIFANVFPTDTIARIDPLTGVAAARIRIRGLAAMFGPRGPEQLLNGIGYDAKERRLFVTGKNWPLLLEIRPPPLQARRKRAGSSRFSRSPISPSGR
jgi:glutaminyl-peptide cyclotransferase